MIMSQSKTKIKPKSNAIVSDDEDDSFNEAIFRCLLSKKLGINMAKNTSNTCTDGCLGINYKGISCCLNCKSVKFTSETGAFREISEETSEDEDFVHGDEGDHHHRHHHHDINISNDCKLSVEKRSVGVGTNNCEHNNCHKHLVGHRHIADSVQITTLLKEMREKEKVADENAFKLIEEEERRKRKSEKKKNQKKKKKEKKKEEKLQKEQEEELKHQQLERENEVRKEVEMKIRMELEEEKKLVICSTNRGDEKSTVETKDDESEEKTKRARQLMQSVSEDVMIQPIISNILIKKSKKKKKNKNNESNLESNKLTLNSNISLMNNGNEEEEEEELMLDSAFVSEVAQRKAKSSLGAICSTTINKEKPFTSAQYIVEYSESNENDNTSNCGFTTKHSRSSRASITSNYKVTDEALNQSLLIGADANKKALDGEFSCAVRLFSEAIQLNPADYRFYVNRSYCFDSLAEFDKALRDAEKSIELNPQWPKCHYRRGRALAGLQKYEEAENSFKKVIELDGEDCVDAWEEIIKVRYDAIIQLGYDRHTATVAAKKYNSVQEAVYSVVNRTVVPSKNLNTQSAQRTNTPSVPNLNGSSNDKFQANIANGTRDILGCVIQPSNKKGPYNGSSIDDDDDDEKFNAKEDVTNPFGWKALWVGNISLTAKVEVIQKMFGKFGKLQHCGLYCRGTTAFALVHYDNSESPRQAVSEYQDAVIRGVSLSNTEPLALRFRPNRDQKRDKYQDHVEMEECYYWRTTGCFRGSNCNFAHKPANKGVDTQPWMMSLDVKSKLKPK